MQRKICEKLLAKSVGREAKFAGRGIRAVFKRVWQLFNLISLFQLKVVHQHPPHSLNSLND